MLVAGEVVQLCAEGVDVFGERSAEIVGQGAQLVLDRAREGPEAAEEAHAVMHLVVRCALRSVGQGVSFA